VFEYFPSSLVFIVDHETSPTDRNAFQVLAWTITTLKLLYKHHHFFLTLINLSLFSHTSAIMELAHLVGFLVEKSILAAIAAS